jgi:hypothetical protein
MAMPLCIKLPPKENGAQKSAARQFDNQDLFRFNI